MTESQTYLCRAAGEGTHDFRVCKSIEEVLNFYCEMFGPEGREFEHANLIDGDKWGGEAGSRYYGPHDMYCATWQIWEVQPRQIADPAILQSLHDAKEAAELRASQAKEARHYELKRFEAINSHLISTLSAIHNFLPPPAMNVGDKWYRFEYPESMSPNDILHKLAERIRAIPSALSDQPKEG